MFNWVRKIVKSVTDKAEWKSKAVNVELNLWKTEKKELSWVSDAIIKFDENLDKFKPLSLAEIKQIYKTLWWKPNNFLDRETLIYLISRKEVSHVRK